MNKRRRRLSGSVHQPLGRPGPSSSLSKKQSGAEKELEKLFRVFFLFFLFALLLLLLAVVVVGVVLVLVVVLGAGDVVVVGGGVAVCREHGNIGGVK